MKLIILFGPQAVGKMTIGQELEKITGLKLFHNHMTIELVVPFFSYKSASGKRLVSLFRKEIFEEVAQSDLEGLIFTYVWAFDEPSDWNYVDEISSIFTSRGGAVYFVELEASTEERLERNKHPHRLAHKATKRDLVRSEQDLRDSMEKHRLNSRPGEIQKERYLRIDTTHLDPKTVAQKIKDAFEL